MPKILKIRPIKGNCITNVQIRNQEARIRKANQLLIKNGSQLSPAQKASQLEQIEKASAQLCDRKFLTEKQYAKQLKKYNNAISKFANEEVEEIKRFTAMA